MQGELKFSKTNLNALVKSLTMYFTKFKGGRFNKNIKTSIKLFEYEEKNTKESINFSEELTDESLHILNTESTFIYKIDLSTIYFYDSKILAVSGVRQLLDPQIASMFLTEKQMIDLFNGIIKAKKLLEV